MIKSIEYTVKGDFNSITLRRDGGSSQISMAFSYHMGCRYATFDLKDLQKAVEILSGQDSEE